MDGHGKSLVNGDCPPAGDIDAKAQAEDDGEPGIK